jgi:hypothetical protein
MKNTLILLLLLLPAIAFSQFQFDVDMSWKPKGVFDTVKVHILVGNVMGNAAVINGFIKRELHSYDGGIDPYARAGYVQPKDRYFDTNVFFYPDKKTIIPNSIVWMHKMVE